MFTARYVLPTLYLCFVWIWEQTAIISLYSINWLVFITETECVYCAVRAESLYGIWLILVLTDDRGSRFQADSGPAIRLLIIVALNHADDIRSAENPFRNISFKVLRLLYSSWQRRFASCCEHGIEQLICIKRLKFLDLGPTNFTRISCSVTLVCNVRMFNYFPFCSNK